MGVVNRELLWKLCAELSRGGVEPSKSELSRKFKLDRKTVRKYLSLINGSDLSPQQISELNDAEFDEFFQRRAHRKDFVEADFKEVYKFFKRHLFAHLAR